MGPVLVVRRIRIRVLGRTVLGMVVAVGGLTLATGPAVGAARPPRTTVPGRPLGVTAVVTGRPARRI